MELIPVSAVRQRTGRNFDVVQFVALRPKPGSAADSRSFSSRLIKIIMAIIQSGLDSETPPLIAHVFAPLPRGEIVGGRGGGTQRPFRGSTQSNFIVVVHVRGASTPGRIIFVTFCQCNPPHVYAPSPLPRALNPVSTRA